MRRRRVTYSVELRPARASTRAPCAAIITAVIPHWNRRELLDPLFSSLKAQSRAFDRIILVDNGSTDGSADAAEKLGAQVLRLDRNVGFAGAVNRGIEAAADAEWIAILNNDVTLESRLARDSA